MFPRFWSLGRLSFLPACLAREDWAEGSVWPGWEEGKLQTLLTGKKKLTWRQDECLVQPFLDWVCQEFLVVFSWDLRQGCSPTWVFIWGVCVRVYVQLHCTAPTPSVLVKDLIFRVLMNWFPKLLSTCNFTPSATLWTVMGGIAHGILV